MQEKTIMIVNHMRIFTVITKDGEIDAEIAKRSRKSTKVGYALKKLFQIIKTLKQQKKKKIRNSITIPIII